jgi:hypothetical protein
MHYSKNKRSLYYSFFFFFLLIQRPIDTYCNRFVEYCHFFLLPNEQENRIKRKETSEKKRYEWPMTIFNFLVRLYSSIFIGGKNSW